MSQPLKIRRQEDRSHPPGCGEGGGYSDWEEEQQTWGFSPCRVCGVQTMMRTTAAKAFVLDEQPCLRGARAAA